MSYESIYDNIIIEELDEAGQKEDLPDWASDKNNSANAYRVINKLYEIKLAYIKINRAKTAYVLKNKYQISKVEVTKIAGGNPQPLFNCNSYSKDLKDYFTDKNDELYEKAIQRMSGGKGGNQKKSKKELVSLVQEMSSDVNATKQQTVEKLLQLTLDKLTIDVKRKMGLH